ncbi:phosphopantothenoylcysteine decarboxylase [Camelimonas abortus]|uniref:Coenzyme A biosynthesis bifunctional protein CoaBC n=1 Tax=Camelimonas abortus TaxID=1017184 RepID=A0ABV7LD48_9HYPH
MLSGRRILLVIGGGVAAYKALDLIRRLKERGAAVRCVMTAGAQEFVTPLSAAALSQEKVFTDLFSLTDEADIGHIRLSRESDLVVVAPATADLMAKAASGLANDLASNILLATDKPVLMAPAMNPRMWAHPATRRNLATLAADGVLFVGPNAGSMAERGESGVGRMAEPLEIVAAVEAALAGGAKPPAPSVAWRDVIYQGAEAALAGGAKPPAPSVAWRDVIYQGAGPAPPPAPGRLPPQGPLAGMRVLVTSGPTHEPIDPVRYIANRSSGRQGHAIAAAAAQAGARVTLVSGPVNLPDPPGVRVVKVETAREMLQAVEAALPADAAVFTAAVADWRVAGAAGEKIKKTADGAPPALALVENPDILAAVSQMASGRPKLVVGFAAETEKVLEHAKAKLARKGCDWIVANDVSPESGVMGGERNTVHLVTAEGVEDWPTMNKDEVARRLVARIADALARAGAGA